MHGESWIDTKEYFRSNFKKGIRKQGLKFLPARRRFFVEYFRPLWSMHARTRRRLHSLSLWATTSSWITPGTTCLSTKTQPHSLIMFIHMVKRLSKMILHRYGCQPKSGERISQLHVARGCNHAWLLSTTCCSKNSSLQNVVWKYIWMNIHWLSKAWYLFKK